VEPQEFSRVIGQILGSGPITIEDRQKVLDAMGEADSIEEMPEDVQQILLGMQTGKRSGKGLPSQESRASRTSKVERRIVKKQTICERCRLNEDPNNVPVHPHCDCDVVTDSLESGVADPESRFFKQLTFDDVAMEIVSAEGAEMPGAIQLNPDTVSILDGENVRFADLARWLEQMQPYLEQGAQYLSIVVDDDTDQALQQTTETLQSIAEGTTDLSEAIRSRKLWFALAKAVAF
jgi:hypothetical protein